MANWILSLPIWGMVRSFGLISFILLTAGITLGILYSFPQYQGEQKAKIYRWHQFLTNSGTFLGLFHGVLLVIDTYMPFSWKGVLIPFAAKDSPFLNGLGTLAAYGTLILILTSDFRHKLKKQVWRSIHFLSYPVFAIALVHGIFLGSDSENPLVKLMYVAAILVVMTLTVYRILLKPDKNTTVNRSMGR